MKVFELHFNPPPQSKRGTGQAKAKEDLIFDSFCYEPENIYEKRLGSLFVVGELKNTLPQNLKFLHNVANFIKKQYFSSPVRFSPETALKESLKKANEFLEGIAKRGDVSWLGNLSLAVFNLTQRQKPGQTAELNFTKVGAMKILLLRTGQIIDIGKNLEFSEIEPYPLKIFGNIVSGKLAEGDILLLLTQDLFSVFSEGQVLSKKKSRKSKKDKSKPFQSFSLIEKIALISPFDEKKLKNVLKTEEEKLERACGTCLLCVVTKEALAEKTKPAAFTFQKEAEKFSIQQVLLQTIRQIKNSGLILLGKLSIVKDFLKKSPKESRLPIEQTKVKLGAKISEMKIFLAKSIVIHPKSISAGAYSALKKNVVLFLFLTFFVSLGFFIFQKQEKETLQEYQAVLTSVEEDIMKAENFSLLKNERQAFAILKKAREDILPLTKTKSAVLEDAEAAKNFIEEKLENISRLEKISDPELFFEFEQKEFFPQKMVFFKESLYFFSPYVKNVFKLNKDAEKTLLETEQNFNTAAALDNSLLFFKAPDSVSFLMDDRFEESFSIKPPYPNFTPRSLAVFGLNLYFLDGENGEIIKYQAPISEGKDNHQLWLKNEAPPRNKVTGAKSMSIDDSVWVLNENNAISRYYKGSLEETITLDLFPALKDVSKISAKANLLYLLEPVQERIIVLTKKGEVLKQFQSEKFNNLLDFAVSEDQKTIWLLNGSKVYKINVDLAI